MLLISEILLGTLIFILKDKGWIKSQATSGLKGFIMHYREDPDQQNLIDWLQSSWECCGIDSPSDWDQNLYFNCTSSILGSREACGVPFSCCKTNSNDIITNKVRHFALNAECAWFNWKFGTFSNVVTTWGRKALWVDALTLSLNWLISVVGLSHAN